MRREALLRHLRRNGCVLRREGKEHSLWEVVDLGIPHPAVGKSGMQENEWRALTINFIVKATAIDLRLSARPMVRKISRTNRKGNEPHQQDDRRLTRQRIIGAHLRLSAGHSLP
jgi:hypothetical protein